MNILIITSLYETEEKKNIASVTKAVHNLVKYWAKSNRVVCIKPYRHSVMKIMRMFDWSTIKNLAGGFNKYKKDDVEIYLLEYCLLPLRNMSSKQSVKFAHKINRLLTNIDFVPDIIITHMPMVEDINKYIDLIEGKCPRIAIIHRSDIDYMDENAVIKMASNYDKVFARSIPIYKELSNKQLVNLSNKIIASGVRIGANIQEKKWDKLGKDTLNILYVGALIKQKGVEEIINALENLNQSIEYKFDIIGDGKEKKRLQKLVKEYSMDNKVFFWGQCNSEFVHEKMEQCDVFIMISKHETLGLVYLEAMSHGCITIGSKDEGIDGIIIDGFNGYLVEALNSCELNKCINELLATPSGELCRISKEAMNTARKYNEEDMSEYYLKIIDDIVYK